jgi:hypothetical protein
MLTDWLLEGVAGAASAAAGGAAAASALAPGSARAIRAAADPSLAAAGGGDGRVATISQPLSLSAVIAGVKAHLGLERVQIALPAAA